MVQTKNIIFDFGNVLFDLDLPAFEQNWRKMVGSEQLESAKTLLKSQGIFEMYETGGLDTEAFIAHLCQACGHSLRPEQVVSAWNSIFIGMPPERFDMLTALRRRYRVFLLSNINDMHERWIAEYMEREHGLQDYEARFFDGVYFSHLIRLRKPDPEIFAYVLADAELASEETVFFDDLPENVAAAEKTGIQGVWHPAGTDIGERLRGMGLLG
jgi:haloacid dehalogenase superfamily, subfamily IA, variant 3 with third motif having DD or ED